jgi:hypothetical protein
VVAVSFARALIRIAIREPSFVVNLVTDRTLRGSGSGEAGQ